MESYKSVISRSQKPVEVLLMTKFVFRPMANPFTYILYKLGVHQDVVTVVSIAVSLIGTGLLVLNEAWASIAAFMLIGIGFVLDQIDGNLARLNNQRFMGGGYLDYFGHQIIVPFIYITLSMGSSLMLSSPWPLFLGAVLATLSLNPSFISKEHILIDAIRKQPALAAQTQFRRLMADRFWVAGSEDDQSGEAKLSLKTILTEALTFPGLLLYMPVLAFVSIKAGVVEVYGLPPIDIRFLFLIMWCALKLAVTARRVVATYRELSKVQR